MPSSVWTTFPAWTSKMLMIPSSAPLAMYFPSLLYARLKWKFKTHIFNFSYQFYLKVNFPFWGSRTCSTFPVMTLYIDILPSFEPEITKLLSGENATVHKSTGPKTTWFNSFPSTELQIHKVESRELLAISERIFYKNFKHIQKAKLFSHFPFGDTSTETIPREWPVKLYKWLNELPSTFHTFTSGLSLPWWMAPDTMKSYSFLISFSFGSCSSPSARSLLSFSLFSSGSGTSAESSPQLHVL